MVSPNEAGRAGLSDWTGRDSEVSQVVLAQSEACLQSYEANSALIEEHANIETSVREGGYGHRQLYELIQNGADELRSSSNGLIHVVLSADTLYCANLGNPITPTGAGTILASHLSRKRGAEIGRFGLGFKSVLSVSDQPQFFSRSGSFGWSAGLSQVRIRERVPGSGPTPVLRIAHLLDAEQERASDELLNELMSWATTVVKLPLSKGEFADRLAKDLQLFPAVFAVFSPHAGRVILEDRRNTLYRREITVSGRGDRRSLCVIEGGRERDPEEWRVFETSFHPSDEAWADAGEYRNRVEVPIAWAVPSSGLGETGQFWAFFPTTYETTLRGVLNAAWKTNEDRQHILEGNAFNEVLMREAARLVVASLPALSTPEDPALPLTLMTARGRETRNWADKMLTDLVHKEAADHPSLPDQTGEFRRPGEINIHPKAFAPEDKRWRTWVERWADYPGRPVEWCHPSVERSPTRRSRADILMETAGVRSSSVQEWLESLVSDGTAAASAVALSIVAEMVAENHPYAGEARLSAILRTADGRMVPPQEKSVFRRTSMDPPTEHTVYVDPGLADDPAVSRFLEILGIREADSFGRFAAAVSGGFFFYQSSDWNRLWLLARKTGAERAVEHLHSRDAGSALKVRTRSGKYKPLSECLLPGVVIPSGSPDDGDFVVDEDFHHDDMKMLRMLGMSDAPSANVDPSSSSWYAEYRLSMIEEYYGSLPAGARRPQQSKIMVTGPDLASHLGLLFGLTFAAGSRFIQNLPVEGMVTNWMAYALTRADDAPLTIPSPLVWVIERTGKLATSMGIRSISSCVGPGLNEHARILPVADIDLGLAYALRLPNTLEAIRGTLWLSLLTQALESENHVELGMLYAVAATQLSAPGKVRCRQGDEWTICPPAEVVATADPTQYRRLLNGGISAVLVPESDNVTLLVDEWGMKTFDEVYITELRATQQGVPTPLEDVFPQLKFEPGRPLRGLFLMRCDALEQLVRTPAGQTSEPIAIGRREETIYWLDRGDDLDMLRELNRLLNMGLSEERCRQVLQHRKDIQRDQQVVKVRELSDLQDKLVAMLGGDIIRERLPLGLIDAVEAEEGSIDNRSIAGLALAVYGADVLREFRQELEDRGFAVPTQMAGSHQAKTFVSDLGFPAEYAGFRQPGLDPVLTVQGPINLPALHDYQELMVGRILEVLRSRPAQRGMVSLPTGAGKTRVAVDALIRWLGSLSPKAISTPVLWVAQTEELCEQAVQTWQLVWQHAGPAQRLTISRLWGSNEADPVEDGYHLVVTTDAKLERVIETERYVWLREAQAVIVDEAHTSISPRYTQVLAALGLTPHRSRCPLIGLSATPFRGASSEETERLAARYGRNRLDYHPDGTGILGDDPYRRLQDLGVLAWVKHEELPGATLDLSSHERNTLEQMRRLPASAEERLGHDTARNRVLIDKILSLPEDWRVLLFATSVNHAQTMAALLTRKGVSAAAVSGGTDLGQRRHVIEQFKQGGIRVLANYGVLSQGFDAPATRAVIVARPTYSPNVYQQMIGRGLRGPKNNGKEECLIVNVADNISQYGEELAFRQFEYLWKNQ
ncbi:DEAD/DEAH box helicase [Streptosporangium sp. NBC_01756]|uniref:DEAD/DEAH box helicase n=1 Tax=Streptosporangium sp. NBC_01756 TaxID=2975950 RepID=UPI002DD84012|nr:DEAD/DEAH box helicase [Streptosporangium sp. NBC_01756]WSC89640.1 DEAD/DEAH box helicase [Streptosporangium sp. NBC_01756]